MSLITPSNFQKTELSEREALVRHGREKAQKDFAQEEAENLIKQSYQEELHKLRKGGPPVSQPAKPTSPPTTRKESVMDAEKRVRGMVAAYMAQSHTPEPLKQVPPIPEPSPEISEKDGAFAREVVETWNHCRQAQKDFSSVAEFHSFCMECLDREAQLRPDQKGIVGLPHYQKLINLRKGPESR